MIGDPHCKKLLTEKDRVCEASIFVKDKGTGQLLKARPDIYSEKLGMMGDVKTCQDASPKNLAERYLCAATTYKLLTISSAQKNMAWKYETGAS